MRNNESYVPYKNCVYFGNGHWIFYIAEQAFTIPKNKIAVRLKGLDNKNFNSQIHRIDWEDVPTDIRTIIMASNQIFIERSVETT